MTGTEPIADLDLFAYADGFLDADPGRKAEVERWLETRPKEAARVREYIAQNEALRQVLDARLHDPVPDRLSRAAKAGRPGKPMPRVAAAVSFLVVASVTSWMIGSREDGEGWSTRQFIKQSFSIVSNPAPLATDADAGQDSGFSAVSDNQPPSWFSEKIALDFHVPDLSSLGYVVASHKSVAGEAGNMMKVEYVHRDGGRFSLLLQPRWKTQDPDIRLKRKDGYSMAYWLDGPLASAVISDMPEEKVATLADAVRSAMRKSSSAPLTVQAAPIPQRANGMDSSVGMSGTSSGKADAPLGPNFDDSAPQPLLLRDDAQPIIQ